MVLRSCFALLGLVITALTPTLASASPDRLVSVSGSCLRKITPDRASVTITSEAKESDPKRATQKAQDVYERVLSKVKALKLPDSEIQTTEYSVEEIKEWENNKMVSRGFRARMGFQVETPDAKRLGEALEIAAKEGVRDVGRLALFVSNTRERDERNACLKEAAEQARIKATKLAESLNAKLGEVITINESGASMPQPRPHFGMAKSAMMDEAQLSAAPTIETGKQELSITIQASFLLK